MAVGADAVLPLDRGALVPDHVELPKLLETVSAPLLQPPFLDEGSTEALPSPSNTNAAPTPGETDAPKNQQQNSSLPLRQPRLSELIVP